MESNSIWRARTAFYKIWMKPYIFDLSPSRDLASLGTSLVPRPIPSFSMLHAESGRARSHVIDFIRMKGGKRVKMNAGEPKVSKVQAAAVHNLPKVRL